ncbi:MAG: nucleotidyltransferase domain-containing protein [Phycisphaerae bacterium]|nr:nucleotidyltransferase domain-containing protein [Phycisphaerae bacterium]
MHAPQATPADATHAAQWRRLQSTLATQYRAFIESCGSKLQSLSYRASTPDPARGELIVISDGREPASQTLENALRRFVQSAKAAGHPLQARLLSPLRFWSRVRAGEAGLLRAATGGAIVRDNGMLLELTALTRHCAALRRAAEIPLISYALVGSRVRASVRDGSDLDLLIVFDDSAVAPAEAEAQRTRLCELAEKTWKALGATAPIARPASFAVYALTDLWTGLHECRPILLTMIADGVPLADRGDFRTWQRMIARGAIRPSENAARLHILQSQERLVLARQQMREAVGDHLYYAVLNATQALLMAWGEGLPTPREIAPVARRLLVQRLGLLRAEDVELIQSLVEVHKRFEHDTAAAPAPGQWESLARRCGDFAARCEERLPAAILMGVARDVTRRLRPQSQWAPGNTEAWLDALLSTIAPEAKRANATRLAALARLLALADAARNILPGKERIQEARALAATIFPPLRRRAPG